MASPVVITGWDQLHNRLRNVSAIGDMASMQFLADAFAETLSHNVPVGRPETTNKPIGALKGSIHAEVESRRKAIVRIGGPESAAISVEKGAPHHPIPKAGKQARLNFFWQKKGRRFVGPRLPKGHPGNRPQPYFYPTVATFNLRSWLRVQVIEAWNKGGPP